MPADSRKPSSPRFSRRSNLKAASDHRQAVVIDTNTVVSALLFPQSIPSKALWQARKTYRFLGSQETVLELYQVLRRDKFERYAPLADRLGFFRLMQRNFEPTADLIELKACRDPKDDKFLSLAIAGKARFLITGDRDLLTLRTYGPVTILSAADFLFP